MSDITAEDLELFHYGVKGMRWGVRRKEGPDGRVVKSKTPIKDSDKSAHRVATEARYIQKGYTTEEAARKADGRIKAQKVLLAVGATAVTAAAVYGGKVAFEKRFTGVDLPMGSVLKNINALGDKQNFDRRMYTTFNEGDTKKYKGLLASVLRTNAENTTIYETSLKATQNIKAPSHHQAKKLFEEFKAENKYNTRMSYREFNKRLVNEKNAPGQAFYDFMKTKGYNAVLDSNDQFISGYNTKKPLILFNASSSTVKSGQEVVDNKVINKLATVQNLGVLGKAAAPYVGLGVAWVGGNKALDTRNRHGSVNRYFKEHPNSKMSYAEVYANLEVSDTGEYIYNG